MDNDATVSVGARCVAPNKAENTNNEYRILNIEFRILKYELDFVIRDSLFEIRYLEGDIGTMYKGQYYRLDVIRLRCSFRLSSLVFRPDGCVCGPCRWSGLIKAQSA